LSKILYKPRVAESVKLYNTQSQDHQLEGVLDFEILREAHPAVYRKEKMTLGFPITNINRTTGAILSNEISKIHGEKGLPEDTLHLNFKGAAGQSFGAFATKGLTMTVRGNTNDYFGKGLSGAKLIVKVPEEATFKPEENVIIGNVAMYGAINGEAYINGIAGERFLVRNSGAKAVVEGIGDHGCEYMTGGIAVILGKIGRNFAAGMSGGIAYIYNPEHQLDTNDINMEMVAFEALGEEDLLEINKLITNHLHYTQSPLAARILNNWQENSKNFIKVMPTEYKKALELIAKQNTEVEQELTIA